VSSTNIIDSAQSATLTPNGAHAGSVVAVLGASNVARGLPSLVSAVRRQTDGEPVELLVAAGHGRSYGLATRVLGRSLPGLLHCGIWRGIEAVAREAGEPRDVVLTDIGNDLVYGVEPARLVDWVRGCLDRLPSTARVTVVAPPLEALATVSELRFGVLRALFFPTHPVRWDALRVALAELAERLRALRDDSRVRLVEPPGSWYGIDPIHHRRRWRAEAWRRLLGERAGHGAGVGALDRALGWREAAQALSARPESWRLFGIACSSRQPCRQFGDGTRLWLF
jgi:hypothetical protein